MLNKIIFGATLLLVLISMALVGYALLNPVVVEPVQPIFYLYVV